MKGLFLYNPADLNAEIPGGVQTCSQEFLKIIQKTVDELFYFEVRHNRSLVFRLLHRLNLDNYQAYHPDHYAEALKEILLNKQITHVFINKSELIRFGKTIKEYKIPNPPRVIVMSHGNESGDLLGDIAGKKPRFKGFFKFTGMVKMGMTLFTESWFRRRYIDLVCTMSEEESAFERWLGLNTPVLLPRLINRNITVDRNPKSGVFGYVGTLNHTPNLSALYQLCEALSEANISPEIRIVGQPAQFGQELQKRYPFIKYLGPLKDADLLLQLKEWSFFINPIFNYSRGASMKLAKAIEWEIPVITTKAGRRGYVWQAGKLLETPDTPTDFVEKMRSCMHNELNYKECVENVIRIKESSASETELGKILRSALQTLH